MGSEISGMSTSPKNLKTFEEYREFRRSFKHSHSPLTNNSSSKSQQVTLTTATEDDTRTIVHLPPSFSSQDDFNAIIDEEVDDDHHNKNDNNNNNEEEEEDADSGSNEAGHDSIDMDDIDGGGSESNNQPSSSLSSCNNNNNNNNDTNNKWSENEEQAKLDRNPNDQQQHEQQSSHHTRSLSSSSLLATRRANTELSVERLNLNQQQHFLLNNHRLKAYRLGSSDNSHQITSDSQNNNNNNNTTTTTTTNNNVNTINVNNDDENSVNIEAINAASSNTTMLNNMGAATSLLNHINNNNINQTSTNKKSSSLIRSQTAKRLQPQQPSIKRESKIHSFRFSVDFGVHRSQVTPASQQASQPQKLSSILSRHNNGSERGVKKRVDSIAGDSNAIISGFQASSSSSLSNGEEGEVLHISFKRNLKSGVVTTLKWRQVPNRLRNFIVDLEDELFLTKREVEMLNIYYLNVERDERLLVKHDLDLVCIRQLCRKYKAVQMFVEVEPHRSRNNSFGNLLGFNNENNSNKYRKIRELGRGAFGVVNLIIDQRGIPMAEKKIRVFHGTQLKQNKLQKIENEINLLESLDHPHIVQYYGTRRDENFLYILLEYVPCGSIGELLKKMQKFDEELISSYLRQTLIGLQYLHSKNVVHRDIKPDNLLLTSLGEIKLADFGCSTIVEMQKKISTGVIIPSTPPSPSAFDIEPPSPKQYDDVIFGTPAFMSPEVVSRNEYSVACDVWAVGCMAIMLYTGKVPWSALSRDKNFSSAEQLMIYIGQGNRPPFPESISPAFFDFLNCCLQIDPDKRAPVSQLIKHPFISADCYSLHRGQSTLMDRKVSIDESMYRYGEDTEAEMYDTYMSDSEFTTTVDVESSEDIPHIASPELFDVGNAGEENSPFYPEPSQQHIIFAVDGYQTCTVQDFERLDRWSNKCDRVLHKPSSSIVTIHRFPIQTIIATNLAKYIHFVQSVSHINSLAKVMCIIQTDTEVWIVQEAVDMNWSEFQQHHAQVPLLSEKPLWHWVVPYLLQTFQQLHHEANYLMLFFNMRDVMFSARDGYFKIKNVGIDKILFSQLFFTSNVQLHNYASPEVINMEMISTKADVWLIGYHLLLLLTGKLFAVDFFMDSQLLRQLIQAEVANEQLGSVLLGLLEPSPEQRLNFGDLEEYLQMFPRVQDVQ